MIFGPYFSERAMHSAAAQMQMQQAAMEAQRQYYQQYRSSLLAGYRPSRAASHRSKCDSCGSREFKDHAGQSVCAYCRSSA